MKTFSTLFFIVISTLFIFSCKKNSDDNPDTPRKIQDLIPDSILNKMKTLGMPIYNGSTPPDIQRIYLVTPFGLAATNIPNDRTIGSLFADYSVKFYSQDNGKLSVKVDYKNGPESGTGLGSIISGSDSMFTVAAKITGLHNNSDSASLVQVISGTLTSGAIHNIRVAFFMLNNYGNASGYWIQSGQGRILNDVDGNSPVVGSLKSASNKNKDFEWKSAVEK